MGFTDSRSGKPGKGIWDALKESQAGAEEASSITGEFSEEAGYEMTGKLLKEHPDLTAVLYGYNVQARGGIRYLIDHHIAIGKDLSVMLIGSPEWAVTGNNNFTHIIQLEYQLGKEAATIFILNYKRGDGAGSDGSRE